VRAAIEQRTEAFVETVGGRLSAGGVTTGVIDEGIKLFRPTGGGSTPGIPSCDLQIVERSFGQ